MSIKKIQKIGIALAAYNPSHDMIMTQITSICEQSFTNWKLFIAIDGDCNHFFSSKKFLTLVDHYNIQYRLFKKRAGFVANFVRSLDLALEDAEVDAIAFCDQDDKWFPSKLLETKNYLETCPSLSLVHSDMTIMYQLENRQNKNIGLWEKEKRDTSFNSFEDILMRNTVTGGSLLMDVQLARKYRKIPREVKFHDHWFALAASLEGGVYGIHRPLYYYIQHKGNVVGASSFSGIFSYEDKKLILQKCLKKYRYLSFLADSFNQRPPCLYFPFDFGLFSFFPKIFLRFKDKALLRSYMAFFIGRVVSFFAN